jgi:hypothetical protein
MQPKARMDSELPSWTKSNTDTDEPRRPTPNVAMEDPNRANARKDNELPT